MLITNICFVIDCKNYFIIVNTTGWLLQKTQQYLLFNNILLTISLVLRPKVPSCKYVKMRCHTINTCVVTAYVTFYIKLDVGPLGRIYVACY